MPPRNPKNWVIFLLLSSFIIIGASRQPHNNKPQHIDDHITRQPRQQPQSFGVVFVVAIVVVVLLWLLLVLLLLWLLSFLWCCYCGLFVVVVVVRLWFAFW